MARPRTDIQPRILHAARARFLAEGVEGASLRQIAKEARTSIGMVFYYYPTKDELFLAVVEEVYEKLLASLDQILSAKTPVRERLAQAFARLGEASDEELDVLRLVVREALLWRAAGHSSRRRKELAVRPPERARSRKGLGDDALRRRRREADETEEEEPPSQAPRATNRAIGASLDSLYT